MKRGKGDSTSHIQHQQQPYAKLTLNTSLKSDNEIIAYYTRTLREVIISKETDVKVNLSLQYNRRIEHVTLYCKGRYAQKESLLFYIDTPNLMYCPVPKVGTTFWSRLLEVIRLKNPDIISPFQISNNVPQLTKIIPGRPLTHNRSYDKMGSLLNKYYKFMFSRDPYHRLFSAFVDKLLSPSAYLWTIGKDAIFESRKRGKVETNACGFDVTFEEYIQYIVNQKPDVLDEHVRPIAHTCDICQMNYNFIGRMESFQQDVLYILRIFQIYGKGVVFKDFDLEYKYDKIVGSVLQTIYLKTLWSKCISVHAGMQRLWRQLQINGLIDMTDTYPFSPEQSHNVTVVDYINVALEAFRRSSPAAKRTKREAYLQAYSMLEPEDLEKLRKAFLSDFEMFDYEQRPAELFDMDRKRKFDFDYLDVMRLK